MVMFGCLESLFKMLFNSPLNHAVMTQDNPLSRKRGKFADTIAVFFQGFKVIWPKNIFFWNIKSGRITNIKGSFTCFKQGNVAGGMPGGMVNGPGNPSTQIYCITLFKDLV